MNRSYCICLAMFCLLSAFTSNAQTTLAAGDIVIIGWNATDNTINTGGGYTDDDVDFLLLRNIKMGTQIYFTDFGWMGSSFQMNEFSAGGCTVGTGAVTDGCIRWTASSDMVKGTQVRIGVHYGLVASSGTVVSINRSAGANGGPGAANPPQMSLSTSFDEVIAFQGSLTSPTLIAAVHYGSAYAGSLILCTTTSSQCVDPGANVGGFGFLYTAATSRNSIYIGPKTGSTATIRTNVLNTTNWTSNTAVQNVFPIVAGFSVLPVHVVSFTGKKTSSGHYLEWEVANEENFDHYEVETSTDGRDYTSVGVVNAENKSRYSFTSKTILPDHQFYRLKLVDHDSKAEYSKIIRLQNASASAKVLIFPNPVMDIVTISSKENIIEMSLTDVTGKVVWKQRGQGNSTTALDIHSFKAGVYILTVTTASGIQAQKIVKEE